MDREPAARRSLNGGYDEHDRYAALEPILSAHLEAHKQGNRCAAAAFAHTSLPALYRMLLHEHMHVPDEHIQDAVVDAVLGLLGEVNRLNLSQVQVVAWLHATARRRVTDRMVQLSRTRAAGCSSRRDH